MRVTAVAFISKEFLFHLNLQIDSSKVKRKKEKKHAEKKMNKMIKKRKELPANTSTRLQLLKSLSPVF